MAIITRKIVTYVKNIKDLSDTPNKDGMTADDLKAFFDGRGDAEIKDSINGIVDDLTAITDGSSGADQIGSTALKVGGAVTVQTQLEELKNDKAESTVVSTHTARTDNPHTVTKAQVDLGNVDNTSDVNKPVSSAGQSALDLKVDKAAGKALSTNDYDNTEKASVASNTAARHSHTNKATLDTYSQTEADLSDAVAKKHAHANKAVIDGISEVTTVLGIAANKVPSEKAVADAISFAGGGDMLKAVYDTTGNGTVDNAELVNGLAVLKAVPANAIFTDTVYTHPTTAGNKHVPTGGEANQILKYSASGTAVWGDPAAGVTIVNNLTETVTGKVLDATQGKNLSDLVSTKLTKFTGTTAGTATALTATITDATLADFTNIQVRLHADLGASATLNLNGLGAKPIYTSGNVAVGVGALTGSMLNLMYNSSLARWYLLDILSVPPAPDLYLYDYGDEKTSVTGGWVTPSGTLGAYLEASAGEKLSDRLKTTLATSGTPRLEAFTTVNKIDLTDITKIKLLGNITQRVTGGGVKIFIHDNPTSFLADATATVLSNAVLEINVSAITGLRYITVGSSGQNAEWTNADIFQVWQE